MVACGGPSDAALDTVPGGKDAATPVGDGGASGALDASVALDAGSPTPASDGGAETSLDASVSDAASAADSAPSSVTTPNETAGTRLKPYYQRISYGDGAEQVTFVGMTDTSRNETCSLQTLEAGHLYCAPSGEPMVYSPEVYFSDPSCTSPVIGTVHAIEGPSCDGTAPPVTNRYFAVPPTVTCAPLRLVPFPATGPLAVTTIYQKSASGCSPTPVGTSPTSITEIYASPPLPLATVAPSAFVPVTRTVTVATGSSRLRSSDVTIAGADGSSWRAAGDIVDVTRNEYCYRSQVSATTSVCMPHGGQAQNIGEFADPGCSKPVFQVDNFGSCVPDVLDTHRSYMTSGASLYPRFSNGALSEVYYTSGTACMGQSVASIYNTSFYSAAALPAPLAPSSFSNLAEKDDVDVANYYYAKSGSQISFKTSSFSSADGFAFNEGLPLVAWDQHAGTYCVPLTMGDGKDHCVPVSYVAAFDFSTQRGLLYADAACAVPVFGASATAPQSVYADRTQTGYCQKWVFYRVPATPLPSQKWYFRDHNNACTVYPNSTANEDLWRVSDCTEVQPSEFASMTTTYGN
jgi:hypothetical protein